MSPEQARGEKLDQRSNIYALGIVLFEMIAGRVPFEAETPLAVILKHLQAPLPLPAEVEPGIHSAVERVLLKALAKDRIDRSESCQEFLAAWKAAVSAASSDPPAGQDRIDCQWASAVRIVNGSVHLPPQNHLSCLRCGLSAGRLPLRRLACVGSPRPAQGRRFRFLASALPLLPPSLRFQC